MGKKLICFNSALVLCGVIMLIGGGYGSGFLPIVIGDIKDKWPVIKILLNFWLMLIGVFLIYLGIILFKKDK